ncbi:DEAD/DEAH box helicase [Nitrosomonas sp. Is37]|uniref:DEAD/DEAH box helicase n=1 Tax=Nitrosomonas sp. Is37 TaxID=3080535 RepID=UPI00294B49A0|nr:DEAD/DEAH box helicase [Nitrosomonas sp. Is37]MDV6345678.1 DEAD/DEAH box helicase [Nitrosomonas sp. Is37]
MSNPAAFDQLNLSDELLRAIADQGYVKPTPIQAQVIPHILDGKDIMGSAETGTGKTASFTLPMLHRLQTHANSSTSPARHPVRALILAPTRELATQIHDNVRSYGKYLQLRSTVIFGGVSIDPQIKELQAGVEILVATPGRLLDHIEQKTINLSKVAILVLDEADRMLDMGFLPDIKRILMLLPPQRQSLIFSATFSEEIKQLADKLLKQPILIEVAKRNAINQSISHIVHLVTLERKHELLVQLIKQNDLKQVLIFVRTKQGVDRLVKQLSQYDVMATAIHGDKNQQQRTQALNDFKEGKIQALVATDVAARGLDIESLAYVINFELPTVPEDYIHRIGRTGRAGSKGNAISLVSESEKEFLVGIERLLQTKLTVTKVNGFETEKSNYSVSSRATNRQRHDGKSMHHKAGLDRSNNSQIGKPQPTPYGRNKPSRPVDPIFTQPYVPMALIKKSDTADKVSHSIRQPSKKVIPALFAPPVIDKHKQE